MVPIFMLHYEHDTDPKMRPKPISPEQREDVIVHMASWVVAGISVLQGASAGQSQCSTE
jgi:uncharacterized protein